MDRVLEFLSDYGCALQYAHLPSHIVHEVKRRIVDTFGCAMGCYNMELPRIARAHALESSSRTGSTVLGTTHRSSPELTALANGVMARYLDFNDTTLKGGHPSDNIMPVLAAAEYVNASIEAVITAIIFAYEVQDRFGMVSRAMRFNGWDNAIYVGLASGSGAAKVMGLGKQEMANAISLAVVPNAAMNQARVGQLSMWKGCSAPNAARNGVFAAMLARRGMTGPSEPFDGPRGFKKQLGAAFDLPAFGGAGERFAIETDKLKSFPCDYEAQCCVVAASELRPILDGHLEDVRAIDVETYDNAIYVGADTRDKWNPTSRETADHSLPYVLAVGLTRGTLWLDDFSEDRIRDPRIHALMQKIEVRATAECNSEWPEAHPVRITVHMKSGEKHVSEARYAKGHPKNPMSDEDVQAKFRRLTEPVLGAERTNEALGRLWRIEELKSVGDLFSAFELDRHSSP